MHPLVAYIPYPVVRDLLAQPGADPVGREQRFSAVALFVDVAGFTPLSEALARYGKAGTEELTALLNTYFGAAIAQVELFGGMVVKFGGDALTALFPYTLDTRPVVARRALQCALELQADLPGQMPSETRAGPFRLATHVGLAAGPVLVTTVGDPALQLHAVIAGSVLGRCAEAETHAQPGEVAAGRELLEGLDAVEAVPLDAEFVRVVRLGRPASLAPLAPLPAVPPAAVATLAAYVHPAIAQRLTAGQASMINEHRRLTILFVDFGGFDYDNDAAVGARLQTYLLAAIGIIERYDGYFKEVEIGDKGSKYIVLFGAPVAHEDENERALRCALELLALGDLPVRIGVNTGLVYCGQVGSADCRNYTAMGDAMNLAARLMTAAAPGTILVSATTRQPARERFAWNTWRPSRSRAKAPRATVYRLAGRRGAAQLRLPEPAYRLPLVGREPNCGASRRFSTRRWGAPGACSASSPTRVWASRGWRRRLCAWRGGGAWPPMSATARPTAPTAPTWPGSRSGKNSSAWTRRGPRPGRSTTWPRNSRPSIPTWAAGCPCWARC